ncbi:Transposase [compost metagenome]
MMRFFGNPPACTVVMEACAGARFTARQLNQLGHVTKLISPHFVHPFVKTSKNDFVDVEAICEPPADRTCVSWRPRRRRSRHSPCCSMREALVRERTQAGNQAHGFLLEFGISLPP